MLEIFVIGGGDFVVNGLNAVAAWTGAGSYRGLLQVVLVIGFTLALMQMAWDLDVKGAVQWFIQSFLLYAILMVPTTQVKVTDRINPSLAPSVVDNVPIGLAYIASFTSQAGDYLTRSAETVFSMPSTLQYSNNGMIYGAKLMEATRQLRITDPIFASNMDEHMKQCVFYDILLGHKSMKTIMESTDIWADIGPGSPARSQKYYTGTATGTTSEILTCDLGYQKMTLGFQSLLNTPGQGDGLEGFAKKLYPKFSQAEAKARLLADLPGVYSAFTNISKTALETMRQTMTLNAFMTSRDNFAGGSSQSQIDAFAATRADVQARNTYTAISSGALKWVPLLNSVLIIVFYALFPVIFPLFLLPKTGFAAAKGYLTGFFYLASWGPLFVILNMIVMSRGQASTQAIAGSGMNMLNFTGIGAVNDEMATLSGYLIMSVPFIAAGMAKGAMAISSHSASFLAPIQSAGEAAGNEATTGNMNFGNANIANSSTNNQSANQIRQAPMVEVGSGRVSNRHSDGTFTHSNENGTITHDSSPGISRMPVAATMSKGFQTDMRQSSTAYKNKAEQLRESASEQTSASFQTGVDLFNTAQKSQRSSLEDGRGENSAYTQAQDRVDSWSKNLQTSFGFDKETADTAARQAFTTGQMSAETGLSYVNKLGSSPRTDDDGDDGFGNTALNGGLKGGVTATTSDQRTNQETQRRSEQVRKAQDYLERESSSEGSRKSRDTFWRAASSSENANVSGLTERYAATVADTRSYSQEATKMEDQGRRVDQMISASETSGFNWTSDMNQEFANWYQDKMNTDPILDAVGWRPGQTSLTTEQMDVRGRMMEDFEDHYIQKMRGDVGPIDDISMGSINGPGISSASEVQQFGSNNQNSLRGRAPNVNVASSSRDGSLEQDVDNDIRGGRASIAEKGKEARAGDFRSALAGDELARENSARLQSSLIGTMPGLEGVMNSFDMPGSVNSARDALPYEMNLKSSSVNLANLDEKMYPALGSAIESASALGLPEPIITSGNDSTHSNGSLHYDDKAFDIRAKNMSDGESRAMAERMQKQLGSDYDVIFEKDEKDPNNDHIHAEYDPKSKNR